MATGNIPSIIIVGCGPHFCARYFEVIQEMIANGKAAVKLVIDLQSQEDAVRDFFYRHNFVIDEYLFLPDEMRDAVTPEILTSLVSATVDTTPVTHILISTEPKAHKPYILWAARNNWDIFCDKPLTAFSSLDSANTLQKDYDEIMHAIDGKSRCVLSCERRIHIGYQYIRNYISRFIQKYKMPITFVDIHFAGGNWVMPDEFDARENHPFKYGYGVLLHSGYHYIDLLMQLLGLNKELFPFGIQDFDLQVQAHSPAQMLHEHLQAFYHEHFPEDNFDNYFTADSLSRHASFGELDVTVNGRIMQHEQILTSFCLKMIENSLSIRKNCKSSLNPYLGSGRIRQEHLIIHLGPLCSIHIQSHPYAKLDKNITDEDFTVTIMNHPTLVEEESLIELRRADFNGKDLTNDERFTIKARQEQLRLFFSGESAESSFASHKDSIALLSRIYTLIKDQRKASIHSHVYRGKNYEKDITI